jgi:transcriptional regulator with XRE-family HTH domain
MTNAKKRRARRHVAIVCGERIATLRKSTGASQAELGKALRKTNIMTVNRWERGHALPSAEALLRISSFFGVTVDHLLGRDTQAA